MSSETFRETGQHVINYGPGLDFDKVIAPYYKLITEIDHKFITRDRFLLTSTQFACFQSVNYWKEILEKYKGLGDFFVDPNYYLMFRDELGTNIGIDQTGQNLLILLNKKFPGIFGAMDVACYLYGIPYKSMPIAVGTFDFINLAMSKTYSRLKKSNIQAQLTLIHS